MSEELEEIGGLGPKTRERLEDAGIETINELAQSDAEQVVETNEAVSKSKLGKLIGRAKQQAVVIQTGDEVREHYDNKERIPTGVEHLDEEIAGGLEAGTLLAVGGDTGSGKTQLGFQLLGNAVQKTGDRCVYIETEPDRYQGKRIVDMFDEKTQRKVDKIPVMGEDALDQQLRSYDAIRQRYDDVGMVVVDSFTSRFRLSEDFEGRSGLSSRSEEFKRHLNKLESLTIEHDCPVILICQVYQNPDTYTAEDLVIYGSSLMMHMVSYLVMMKNTGGALSNVEVRNHPNEGDANLDIQIVEDGVQRPP